MSFVGQVVPVERLWAWLRSHQLANRMYEHYDDLLRETDRAWLRLDEATISSVLSTDRARDSILMGMIQS